MKKNERERQREEEEEEGTECVQLNAGCREMDGSPPPFSGLIRVQSLILAEFKLCPFQTNKKEIFQVLRCSQSERELQ
ncbi:hypothetical protein RUM43_011446 [Polyplax serrata]|uniref:Uncharacterized protein n=1 Tax=Polyplax serrata TaxID=468196 RepID=A0AAN8NY87_POLSC